MDDIISKIGMGAGLIYHELESGECNLTHLKNNFKKSGLDSQILLMSLGWLARENKVSISKKGNKWSINLK